MLGEQIVRTNEATTLALPLCPVCQLPAHASETDDLNRHRACQAQGLSLLWRVLDDCYGYHDHVLVEVRHLAFDEATDRYVGPQLTSILECDVSDDGSQVFLKSGPSLDDRTEDELRDDLEAWWTINCARPRRTMHCADRGNGPSDMQWERARDTIARLEAERDARRTVAMLEGVA